MLQLEDQHQQELANNLENFIPN